MDKLYTILTNESLVYFGFEILNKVSIHDPGRIDVTRFIQSATTYPVYMVMVCNILSTVGTKDSCTQVSLISQQTGKPHEIVTKNSIIMILLENLQEMCLYNQPRPNPKTPNPIPKTSTSLTPCEKVIDIQPINVGK